MVNISYLYVNKVICFYKTENVFESAREYAICLSTLNSQICEIKKPFLSF